MRRFQFRLQRLLDIRRHIEREWEIRLAEKAGICQVLRNRLVEVHRQRAETFHEQPAGRPDLELLCSTERFRSRLEQERGRLEQELAARMLEQEEVRRRYQEASRDRKVLDKLREKQEASRRADGRREEARAMDEIAGRQACGQAAARREDRFD